jgi:cell division protease FtsH
MRNQVWTVIGCMLGALLLLALFNLFSAPTSSMRPRPTIDYSGLLADVDAGQIDAVTFSGSRALARRKDGRDVASHLPHAQVIPALTDRLLAKGVTVSAIPADDDVPSAVSLLANWLPAILFYLLIYFAVARPVLAVARQIEALVKTMQERPTGPPAPRA